MKRAERPPPGGVRAARRLLPRVLLLAQGLLLVQGCADTAPPRPEIPVAERPGRAGGGFDDPRRNPAVTRLLNEARAFVRRDDNVAALTQLERAARIAPGDSLIWHEMATVRYRRGERRQSLILARKSISLAVDDPVLQLENWKLIRTISEEEMDYDGTGQAMRAIERLEAEIRRPPD